MPENSPATGHGLSLLELPHVVTETIKVGPMADEVRTIRDMLVDPRRTVMNIVALPEEMPTVETLELRDRMDDTLQIAPGLLFANGIWPPVLTPEQATLIDRFQAKAPKVAAPFEGVFETVRFMTERRSNQDGFLARLESEIRMPMVRIPYHFGPTFGREAIEAISAVIDEATG